MTGDNREKQLDDISKLINERKFNEAINMALPIYTEANKLNEKNVVNQILMLIMEAYYVLGDYGKAFFYGKDLMKSVEEEEVIADKNVLFYLAMIFFELDELDKTDYYLKKMTENQDVLKEPYQIIQVNINRSMLLVKTGKSFEAQQLMHDVKVEIDRLESPTDIIIYYYHMNIAEINISINEFELAFEDLEKCKAMNIYEEIEEEQLLYLFTLGMYYNGLNEKEKLIETLKKGYSLAKKLQNTVYQRDFLKLIYEHKAHIENLEERLELVDAYLEVMIELQKIKTEFLGYGIIDEVEKNELSRKVKIDHLTGLKNRIFLDEYYENLNDHKNLTCIIFDIDDFKRINDTFGHQVGDEVIIEIARISKLHFQDIGVVARLGGDEFTIFIQYISIHEIERITNEFMQKIRSMKFKNIDNTITISLGIVNSDQMNISDVNKLIYEADMKLYQAKRDGKNQISK